MPSSSGDQSTMEMVEIRDGLVFMCRIDIVLPPSLLLTSLLLIVSITYECDVVTANAWLSQNLEWP